MSDISRDDSGEFDEWAGQYDDSVRGREDFPFLGYESVLKRVIDLSAARPPCSVLDVGIGTGNLARHFVDLGCEVWGIDFSANMLDLAKAKLPELHLIQADLLAAWPDEVSRRFDLIVSAYVFHHFELREKVSLLTRLGRDHCAQGGRIVVADISFPTRHALDEARTRWQSVWDEEQYWVAEEAVPACERAGLVVRYEQMVEFAGVFLFERRRGL